MLAVGPDPQMTFELEQRFANLSDWQWDVIAEFDQEGQRCMVDYWYSDPPAVGICEAKELKSKMVTVGLFCNATWDNFKCWPATQANTTVRQTCPDHPALAHINPDVMFSFRTCNASGEWADGDWTNYSLCVPYMPQSDDIWKAKVLVAIYFYGSILSFILLVLTLGIFCCFKSLQCNRISIHKNLVLSFIIRSVSFIALFEPFITGREHSYREIDWLCKLLTTISYYSLVASIFWMFVEGMFLHNRVAISVFNTEAPFRLFYVIGWGLPAATVIGWAVCMELFNPNTCWHENYKLHYTWIIVGPVMLALSINTIFLINIIRILVTKLRANNTVELDQVRKAVKATAILFPLLGLTLILFFIIPQEPTAAWEMAYRVTNAVSQSSQGVLVSVIYCFMNTEVQIAVTKRWQRYKSQRLGSRERRRSSSTARSSCTLVGLTTSSASDKCRRTRHTRTYPPMDEYSLTYEEDFSTVQTTP